MSDFELVLDDCLQRLTSGTMTVEECLSSHPGYASQLQPLLQNAAGLMQAGREMHVSLFFKARGRAKLSQHMRQYPRQQKRKTFILRRFVMGTAVLMLALLSAGTARAQNALPGELFYPWKLTSELIWRGVSRDADHVDLMLADRRINEIVATVNDPTSQAKAVHDYEEILSRLESPSNVESQKKILSTLKSHQKSLKNAGVTLPQLDDYLDPNNDGGKTNLDLPQTPAVIEIPLIP